MGDLIIKPASSGSLKIQDQAGTNFITTGTSAGLTLDSGVTFPAGHVIQVVQSTKKDTDSTTSTSYTTITGTDQNGNGSVFSASITPKQTGSYILIHTTLHMGSSDAYTIMFGIQRDGTILETTSGTSIESMAMQYSANVTASSHNMNFQYLDKNASATAGTTITYRPVMKTNVGTMYVNRISSNANATNMSTFILYEISV